MEPRIDPPEETDAEIKAQGTLDDWSEGEIIREAVKRGILESGGPLWNRLVELLYIDLVEEYENESE